MGTLNLGILAHVDAGKTTLTERLLYAAGVIDKIGSVDAGTTQTDYLALERERGITIRSAVASFVIGDLAVNLIDTPGHPDFIAEVERVLSVLDGAVLVVSAVEGVQSQTPLLMRALQRLRVPTLIFVNKIDRPGADDVRVLEAIRRRLTPAIVPMGSPRALGTRAADINPASTDNPRLLAAVTEVLAERDEAVLAAYVEGGAALPSSRLLSLLAQQTRDALVHPLFFGSAVTGAGVNELRAGLTDLLPAAAGDPDGPVSGRVFKIERTESGEKVAFVRLFSGSLRARDRIRYGDGLEAKVTAVSRFGGGDAGRGAFVSAGGIAKVWGLAAVQVGDDVGDPPQGRPRHRFPPPTLEAVVVPRGEHHGRLRTALAELSEQDPLINARQDDTRRETSVSLYGEVQQEVIQATLARDYGVDVEFRETTTICIERPVGAGEALEILYAKTKTNITGKSSALSSNPFRATLGLRIDPAAVDSGVGFRLDVDVRLVPLYIYKTTDVFAEFMHQYVRDALQEGLHGWQVSDCVVTVNDCGYGAPGTTAADFRKLTPLVLMRALEQAGTQVCEPMSRVTLEVPSESLSGVLSLLARLGASVQPPQSRDDRYSIVSAMPVALVREVRRRLPALTSGEGLLEADFAGYQPVSGPPPERRRTRPNPLNREDYLMHMNRRV